MEHDTQTPQQSLLDLKQQEEAKSQQAQTILKRVFEKHLYEMEKRTFDSSIKATEGMEPSARPVPNVPSPTGRCRTQTAACSSADSHQMRDLSRKPSGGSSRAFPALATLHRLPRITFLALASLKNVVDSGTGLVGDALGDAYDQATDKIAFVANTVIDTVGKAMTILLRGFTDFRAWCSLITPSARFAAHGFHVFFGASHQPLPFPLAYVQPSLPRTALFHHENRSGVGDLRTRVGSILPRLPWREDRERHPSIEGGLRHGSELVQCTQKSSNGLVTCLGNNIINYVPPLSTFNKMNDVLADFLEKIARVASTIAGQVLKGGSSFIQEAVKTKFPAAGAPALVHHRGQNLVVTTHTQKRGAPMSVLQTAGDDPPRDGITFELHNDDGKLESKLVTPFNGFETDTSSCLAFAPSHKTGHAGQANPADWQVRCVTVTYAINVQPVIAFIGGLQFDVMPKPLASVDTTVCWPKGRPDGQDLSMLRTELKSSGVLLYSKTRWRSSIRPAPRQSNQCQLQTSGTRR